MIITYHGKQFFKIEQGKTIIAINPISKDSKLSDKPSRFGAGLALISVDHPDYNGVDTVTYGETIPFVISGPGEYEARGVTVSGVGIETVIDKQTYYNTVYTITLEGTTIVFLGALARELTAPEREKIGLADILFVPIGGGTVLDARAAYKLSVSLEPNIIIPMDYTAESLKTFLKEDGGDVKPIDKLTVRKKDIEAREGDVVVLEY